MLRMRVSFISVMVVIMIIWITAHHHQVASAEAMLADVRTQRDQVEELLIKKSEMEKERAALATRRRLMDCLEDDVNTVVLMSELSRSMPQTVILTRLILTAPGVAQFGVSESTPKEKDAVAKAAVSGTPGAPAHEVPQPVAYVGPKLEMFGVASEASEVIKFAAALERSTLVSRVSMQVKGPADWAGRRVEQFEMTCELVEQTRK